MLFFLFGEQLDLKTVKIDAFGKIGVFEDHTPKVIQIVKMFLQQDGSCQIQFLAQLMDDRRPAGRINRTCGRKLPHDLFIDMLIY